MFLKKAKLLKELLIIVTILTYAYLVNWFSGNIGVMPIDTFGFFDTGYSILQGHLPIRDFWIFTGLLVDYMEAIFRKLEIDRDDEKYKKKFDELRYYAAIAA